MTTLFINFDVTTGLKISTFRHPSGYANSDVVGLVEDMVAERNGCCPLEGALEALEDGAAWAGSNATAEILEQIVDCIHQDEAAAHEAGMQQYDKNLNH